MALKCAMIQDIRKYEIKVWGPFTKRQLICMLISICVAAPIALILPLKWMDRIIAGSFLAVPIMLCGYVKIDGTPPEVYALRYIYRLFLTPCKRKWQNANPYLAEYKKIQAEKQKKQKPKKIKYSKKEEFKIYR